MWGTRADRPCVVAECDEPRAVARSGNAYTMCRTHLNARLAEVQRVRRLDPDFRVRERGYELRHRASEEWKAAHRERLAARMRRNRANRPTHYREKTRESVGRWRSTPEGREKARRDDRLRARTPERRRAFVAAQHKRRAALGGILLIVHVESDVCGVCQEPLTGAAYPDPLSTTIGHEPPLATAKRDGWRVVTERPEHWLCNQRKGARYDIDMRTASASR